MNNVKFFRITALFSFFGLLITYLCWVVIAPHADNYPTSAMLVFGVAPLLFPLRGILHGRPYTHAWTSFLMLFYFTHAVGELYSADFFSIYALLAVLFSLICFSSCILFVKTQAKSQHKELKKGHNEN